MPPVRHRPTLAAACVRAVALAALAMLAACVAGEAGTPNSFTPYANGRAGFYGATTIGR